MIYSDVKQHDYFSINRRTGNPLLYELHRVIWYNRLYWLVSTEELCPPQPEKIEI